MTAHAHFDPLRVDAGLHFYINWLTAKLSKNHVEDNLKTVDRECESSLISARDKRASKMHDGRFS